MFSRPLYGSGETVDGAVAVLVDIEEHRQLQEQLDAQSGELAKIGRLTLIGQIIDTIAHRLSQPLSAIANYAGAAIQMQQSGALDEERLSEVLNLITQQAERGGGCLQDLRALRQRGTEPPDRVVMDQVIESAVRLLEDRLKRNNIQSELALCPDQPALIGKKIELQQAIVHLILNAQESLATREQPRILKIVTTYAADSGQLEIAIGDNGPGVPPELRDQIFEAWFTSKSESLGLGLAVAQSIVEDHNGVLELRNRDDGLTWFVIGLPVEKDDYE
jgi:two-component system sensor kinase FixL